MVFESSQDNRGAAAWLPSTVKAVERSATAFNFCIQAKFGLRVIWLSAARFVRCGIFWTSLNPGSAASASACDERFCIAAAQPRTCAIPRGGLYSFSGVGLFHIGGTKPRDDDVRRLRVFGLTRPWGGLLWPWVDAHRRPLRLVNTVLVSGSGTSTGMASG